MDITSLLNLTPAGTGTGTGNSTGRRATGETAARFAETLQAATARSSEALAAGSATAGIAVQTSPLATGSLLQQLAPGPITATLAAPLSAAAIADAEPVEAEWSDTELAEAMLGESGEAAGIPAMALLSASPAAMPSAEIAGSGSPLSQAIGGVVNNRVGGGVGEVVGSRIASSEAPLAAASLAPPAPSASPMTSDGATASGVIVSPLAVEAAQAAGAESLPLLPTTPSAASPTAGQALPAAPALAMQSALGSAAWGDEFGQHLLNMVHRGEQQVDLYLHPRELGALSVSLSLDDQGARAQFFSAHGAVRSAVEQALPHLREALAQQGISLGETSVGDQRQPAHQQQSASAQHNGGNARGNSGADQFGSSGFTGTDDAPGAVPVSLRAIDFYA
ncbi:hypothetical protein GNX18_09090 [Microbulbifer sp. SH-1]|uniref:flagellar hook-length control protein FliK n=1 Tax=Microbulbifer sp. SH-1 TaxID=2681547 RepID=UPI00140C940D|nr:flagellar hook-length control protein FliK [Microbulbifer sp. SH-1]QIL89890.1 hypothetical protein GNX18_09090 [Microbulbifer sp. SH-1]